MREVAEQVSGRFKVLKIKVGLLVRDDPYTGVQVREGKLVLPEGPGLGLKPALSERHLPSMDS